VLTNPGDSAAVTRLSAYGVEGFQKEVEVEVAPSAPLTVNVGRTFGTHDVSVMVESNAGDLIAEHRVMSGLGADQVPCATTASDRWFFPSQSTVLGATAKLVLFNPFSADAGVDIAASLDDGVRLPANWSGIVVPAGTTRVIDLGESVQRRGQFAVSVQLRTGRLVAETVQSFDDDKMQAEQPKARGVRLQLGVPRPATEWIFADGFTGTGVAERLVVFNPGEEKVAVAVQVTPFGAADLPPEPFELEVAPRRFSTIDLSAETRIPGQGFHAIRVESDAGVVVGRTNDITAAPGDAPEGVVMRPDLPWGTAIGTGSTVTALDWVVPQVIIGDGQQPMVQIHNPNDGIVLVSARIMGGEADGQLLADGIEVAPSDSIVLPLSLLEIPDGEVGVAVEAESPVVVERIITFADQEDLSMGLAVPRPLGGNQLIRLGS
jgi:hypothetical protein